jgi:hypothetical protein
MPLVLMSQIAKRIFLQVSGYYCKYYSHTDNLCCTLPQEPPSLVSHTDWGYHRYSKYCNTRQ